MRVFPGTPDPLGATWDGEGVNFALFTEHASAVTLCLFDGTGEDEVERRIPLTEKTHATWHGYFPGLRPSQRYAYRVDGPWDPTHGQRFNPAKLLLDPCARAVDGPIRWHEALCSAAPDPNQTDLSADPANSAAFLPRCVVVDPSFVWSGDRPPRTPWNQTVIYECHVRGLSQRHPEVAENLRGTYLGLAAEPIIDHLHRLGVTAVELLPVAHCASEKHLASTGHTNYWGYNPIGFFAPDERFAAVPGRQVEEFKAMVKALHRAGIEVILDVVYNHSGEGGPDGPCISLRGIDNASYYRLDPSDPTHYLDYSGCGNSLELRTPATLRLVMDSLRYWVTEMHVDGFRFDLATSMARQVDEFDPRSNFLAILEQDPVLSQVKLIAEPWDLGPGGYRLSGFPRGFAEWNNRYRDTLRRFWRGDPGAVGELASRLAGSSDLFGPGKRTPQASLNFITSHDGFTLQDLVSYEHKHNEANGEGNRDGHDDNLSRNWGAEGPTDKRRTLKMRERMTRNFLASLAFSQGVPMLTQGDEMGRSQAGNNNAYCQDNELAWVDWKLDTRSAALLEFTRKLFRIRRENGAFRLGRFLKGEPVGRPPLKDLIWIRRDGQEMKDQDWHQEDSAVIGMLVNANACEERTAAGARVTSKTFLLVMNGSPHACLFHPPELPGQGRWIERINTACPMRRALRRRGLKLAAHSLILLEHQERGTG